ncbi:MAG TPA: tetratricopeptide repeat protein, partial [Thermoplasmata archaeon]|nr:tetratricopeptide repeat protein [Thermoplasmata archaeon]
YKEYLGLPGDSERGTVFKEIGHALRDTNRLTEAEEAYEEAVKLGTEDLDLFWGLVEVLALLNQDARALRYVDLILQHDPHNPLFLRRKGQLLVKSGRRDEGLSILKQAVENAHGDPHVRFEVAEALRAEGAYPDALKYFEEGLALDPKSRPGRLALAETLLLAGRFNEAIPHIDKLLHEDANDLRAWMARADAYRALHRSNEVLYSLRAILLLDPVNSSALTEKARLHLAAGEKPEAFECLQQLLQSNAPESQQAPAWLELGDLASELGRAEEANRAYERASQIEPSRLADVATRRAKLRLDAGRPDLGLEVLDQAQPVLGQLPPERQIAARLLRGRILLALERQGEAQAAYEEVRRADPHSAEAVLGIGRCLLDQGKHAEAKRFLSEAVPLIAPSSGLFLLLSEAESGLGAIPDAIRAVQAGVETLPRSVELWVRLGELNIRQEQWAEAANAFGHAIALDASNADLQLRAGFVAEKLGHPHEALALYERATQVAPANKYAWSSRGVALLAVGRAEESQQSFDRSLALDSDFDAAKEGKRAALQRTREAQIEKNGREALLLEAKLHRPVTKNDLFVSLHVPFELLDPVLQALSRTPKVEIDRLSEVEMRDLESASYHLIAAALERRPEGIERRGFTLADVAVLAPANYSLADTQRLFGYLKGVLEMNLRPENLRLTPDVEELARKALLLPEDQRTLFNLVRTLHVGVFKARLIKAVESAGTAVHTPLPSLDLGQYSPEFQAGRNSGDATASPRPAGGGGAALASPAVGPAPRGPEPVRSSMSIPPAGRLSAGTPAPRCVGCGGIASVIHRCGAPVCQ